MGGEEKAKRGKYPGIDAPISSDAAEPFDTTMRVDEVDLGRHHAYIQMAESGARQCATILMADAAILISHGLPLPEPLRSYIARALFFSALPKWEARHLPVEKAFNLENPPYRNKYNEHFRKHLICMEVQRQYLRTGRYKSTEAGPGAFEIVADLYDYKDMESVEKVFKNNHKHWNVTSQTAEELDEALEIHRHLFERDAESGRK